MSNEFDVQMTDAELVARDLEAAGKPEAALFFLKQQLDMFNSPSSMFKSIARLSQQLGNLSEAVAVLECGIHMYPNDLQLRIQRAEAAMSSKDWSLAIKQWEHIENSFAKFPPGLFVRKALALIEMEELDLAWSTLQQALQARPDFTRALDLMEVVKAKKAIRYVLSIISSGSGIKYCVAPFNSIMSRQDLVKFPLNGWIALNKGQHANIILSMKDGNSILLDFNVEHKEAVASLQSKKPGDYDALCGFNYEINILDLIRVGLKVENTITWIFEVKTERLLQVIEGKESWLFLANDSNKSVDIHTGAHLLSTQELDKWRRYLNRVINLQSEFQCALLIAPSKEHVMTNYHPFERGALTLMDQIMSLDEAKGSNLIFPIDALKRNSQSFFKTDTHWSDFGAAIALNECMAQFHCATDWLDLFKFEEVKTIGDLGCKLIPEQSDMRLAAHWTGTQTANLLYNNHLINSGNLKIYENPKAWSDKKIVVFGDSFSTQLINLMKHLFSKIVYFYSPASPILDVLDFERPDFVLLQTNERFVERAPVFFKDLTESYMAKKISSMTAGEKQGLQSKLAHEKLADSIYHNFILGQLH